LRLIGLALAACEKSVQIVYERQLRPAEKQHRPWLERVEGQLLAAYGELERELARVPLSASEEGIDQAGVSVAVAWRFTQLMLPEVVKAADFPALQAFGEQAEQLPAFVATPAV
jgi:glutathione S-transferase